MLDVNGVEIKEGALVEVLGQRGWPGTARVIPAPGAHFERPGEVWFRETGLHLTPGMQPYRGSVKADKIRIVEG